MQALNPSDKTVAAVFLSPDERQQRAADDALAADLTAGGAHGVPASTLLPNERPGDAEAVLARLKEAGANDLVMRWVRVSGARWYWGAATATRSTAPGVAS